MTIKEIQKALETAVKNGVSEGAVVLWADMVQDGDRYCTECDAVPGSLLLGLEFFDKGQIERGTLQIQPSKLSDYIC